MEGGPPSFPQGFSCPAVLRIPISQLQCRLPDSHRLWSAFPDRSTISVGPVIGSYNPEHTCVGSVWALPGSLATTTGISVDFSSSGY